MQDFFIKGDPIYKSDMHSWTANRMYPIILGDPTYTIPPKEVEQDGEWVDNPLFTSEHGEYRGFSKTISFLLAYGGGAFTLSKKLKVAINEAESAMEGYFGAFPGLEEDFEKTKAKALRLGYVDIDPYTGRRWFFKDYPTYLRMQSYTQNFTPEGYWYWDRDERDAWNEANGNKLKTAWSKYHKLKGKLEKTALNYRCQGSAGGMTKLAVIMINNWVMKNNIQGFYITNIIHDNP